MSIEIKDIERIQLDVKLVYDLLVYFLNSEYTSQIFIENINTKDEKLKKQLRKANNKYSATRTFLNISFDYLLKIKEDLNDVITLYYKEDK